MLGLVMGIVCCLLGLASLNVLATNFVSRDLNKLPLQQYLYVLVAICIGICCFFYEIDLTTRGGPIGGAIGFLSILCNAAYAAKLLLRSHKPQNRRTMRSPEIGAIRLTAREQADLNDIEQRLTE